jgi:PAS domain S-box-containing protein
MAWCDRCDETAVPFRFAVRREERGPPTIERYNDAVSDQLGWGPDELVGEPLNSVVESIDGGVADNVCSIQTASGDSVRACEAATPDGIAETVLYVPLVGDLEDTPSTIELKENTHRKDEPRPNGVTGVLQMTAAMAEAESVDEGADIAIRMLTQLHELPLSAVWHYDRSTELLRPFAESQTTRDALGGAVELPPDSVAAEVYQNGEPRRIPDVAESGRIHNVESPVRSELLVPVGEFGVMAVGALEPDKFDDQDLKATVLVARALEAVVTREANNSQLDANHDALRTIHNVVTNADGFDETVEALLSLGCDYLSLETGVVARVDDGTYHVEHAVDTTGRVERGDVYPIDETLCSVVVDRASTDPIVIPDVQGGQYADHPGAAAVGGAYAAVPILVDGEVYGTVCFSGPERRLDGFHRSEIEVISALAQWIGNEVERQLQRIELQRYETILEAVGDPVYALDTDGQFTYLNASAEREFGYGDELIGQHVSVGMNSDDVDRITTQLRTLTTSDQQALTTEFTIEDADGTERDVENKIALIGDDEMIGSAGVLRDITERKERNKRLESFKEAIETAQEGVAILDGDTYTYVDQTHVEMYGFEQRSDLLGKTWRELYDSAETVEWFESEVLPAVADNGRWDGRVTSELPDGSELTVWLSLTALGDGQTLCLVRDETDRVARERRRQRNERRFQSVFNDPQAMVVSTAADGSVIEINETAREFVDNEGEDPVGVPLWEISWFDDKPRFRSDARERVKKAANGEYVQWEQEFEHEGEQRFLSGSVRPVLDEDGTVESMIVSCRDVTARERRRRDLESFKRAIESAEDGVAVLEGDEYTFIDRTHVEMYGFERTEDLVGETWRELYSENEVNRLEAEAFPSLESDGYWRGKVTGSRPDGSTFPAELSLTIIDDGRLVCTVRDETEKRERKRELELKEQAMDAASVGIQITDPTEPDNPLVYVNDGFERITGYDREEVLGSNPRFLQGEATDESSVEAIREGISEERSVTLELQNECKDGTEYWNRLSITPVFDDDEVVNYIGIQQDVTERYQRIEALERRQQRLDLTLSGTGTGIIEIDTQTGEVIADSSLESVVGSGSDTFDEILQRIHPDNREAVAQAFESLGQQKETWSGEVRIAVDGSQRWVSIRATTVKSDGGSHRTLATVTDITTRKRREKQLFQERERFQMLVDAVDEYAFVVLNDDATIATWNDGAEQLFGYDEQAAVGMQMAALHPPDERADDVPTRLLKQARIAGTSADSGTRVRSDGSTFQADVRYAPLKSDTGDFQGYAMICRDLTDQREQERRTRRFIEESVDVVSVLESDATLEYVSPAVKRVLNYETDEIAGENLFDFVHPDEREEAMNAFFSTEASLGSQSQVECRVRTSDGSWRTLDIRMFNYTDDAAIGGILLYLRDITQEKRQERRFEGIFNNASQFIGLLNAKGAFLEVNESLAAHARESATDLTGSAFVDLSWWDRSDSAQERASEALELAIDGEFARYETQILTPMGLITVDLSISPVMNNAGEAELLIVEARDINKQYRQRQYLQALQRVLRHNIRNDLTKAWGYLDIVENAIESDRAVRAADVLEDIFDTWDSMTKKTGEIQRVLSRDDGLVRSEVGPLLSSTLDEARPLHPEMTVTVDGDSPQAAVAGEVKPALIELIDNAVTASPDDHVSLSVSASDGWVTFEVTENGPGLPEMEAAVLNEGEETPLNHGQGLGLWLVRMVVTGAGGEVSIRDNNPGTTVELRVPDIGERRSRVISDGGGSA